MVNNQAKEYVYFVIYNCWNSVGQGIGRCKISTLTKAGTYDWVENVSNLITDLCNKRDGVKGSVVVLVNWKRLKGDETH
jgi:hypothetical protein